jgi:hypothetical protein
MYHGREMSTPESSGAVVNAVANAASSTVGAVTTAAAGTVNAVTNAASNTVDAVTNAATNIFNSVSSTANTVAKNTPFLNTMLSNNTSKNAAANKPQNAAANKPQNAAANNSSMFNVFGNSTNKGNAANKPQNAAANKPQNAAANSSILNTTGSSTNKGNAPSANAAANSGSYGSYPLYIFVILIIIFTILFSVFTEQIKLGYQYIESNIRRVLNMSVPPDVSAALAPPPESSYVTVPAEAPQDITPKEASIPQPSQQSIVEKMLPPGGNEVFNIAQNKFAYYDAEPLCNALGAELATYEQVKDAWENGADWCNYGWVKGQMAVYPTQKETYDKLQMGPVDQRNVCGTVGLNGGYFDNPEFKYGVNCYGKKPSQTAHDEAMLMSEGKAPKRPETLKVDELVAEYKDQADALFVKPFNDAKWATA